MSTLLQIFAKAPIAGQVKTRLMPLLGAAGATAFYQQLVYHALQGFADVYQTQVWCAPDYHHVFFQNCQQNFGVSLQKQQGDDLGQRMLHALSTSRTQQQVLLIGSDCPNLTLADLRQADTALQQGFDVVFAPTEDGGYCLIGWRQPHPSLLLDMQWSVPSVMQQTRLRVQQAQLRSYELPLQWDIDQPADVKRWQRGS